MRDHPPIPITDLADNIERLKANDGLKFSQEYEVRCPHPGHVPAPTPASLLPQVPAVGQGLQAAPEQWQDRSVTTQVLGLAAALPALRHMPRCSQKQAEGHTPAHRSMIGTYSGPALG